MARGKQIELGAAAALVTLVEYSVSGKRWRCNHFDQLGAEVGLTDVAQLPLFHDQASANERPWMIVRRLFGIQPVLPSAKYPIDDLRVWERKELCEALGITRANLQEEMAMVRGAWSKICPQSTVRNPQPEDKPQGPEGELYFAEEELVKKHGFNVKFTSQEQAAWFAARVKDYEKLLNEKVMTGLAHNALMTELMIRHLDDYMAEKGIASTGIEGYHKNLRMRQELDKTYREQTDQILEKAPWASSIAGKYAFVGVLADITKAIQNYQARGDTQLIDGMFTAMEIRVECRRSVQTPAARYRAGLVTHVASAKAGLWDPNWQSPFTPAELKRLDQAWEETMRTACREAGEPLPDLEKEGPEGEYQELVQRTEARMQKVEEAEDKKYESKT